MAVAPTFEFEILRVLATKTGYAVVGRWAHEPANVVHLIRG